MTEPVTDGATHTLAGNIAAMIVGELPCIAKWSDTFAAVAAEQDEKDQALINISVTPWERDSVAEDDHDPIMITARVEIRALARQERQPAAISSGKHGS